MASLKQTGRKKQRKQEMKRDTGMVEKRAPDGKENRDAEREPGVKKRNGEVGEARGRGGAPPLGGALWKGKGGFAVDALLLASLVTFHRESLALPLTSSLRLIAGRAVGGVGLLSCTRWIRSSTCGAS